MPFTDRTHRIWWWNWKLAQPGDKTQSICYCQGQEAFIRCLWIWFWAYSLSFTTISQLEKSKCSKWRTFTPILWHNTRSSRTFTSSISCWRHSNTNVAGCLLFYNSSNMLQSHLAGHYLNSASTFDWNGSRHRINQYQIIWENYWAYKNRGIMPFISRWAWTIDAKLTIIDSHRHEWNNLVQRFDDEIWKSKRNRAELPN